MNAFEILALRIAIARAKRTAKQAREAGQDAREALADLEATEKRLKDFIERTKKENERCEG